MSTHLTRKSVSLARPTAQLARQPEYVDGRVIFWTANRIAFLITLVWVPLVLWVLWFVMAHPRFF